jgi:hypothetical protein
LRGRGEEAEKNKRRTGKEEEKIWRRRGEGAGKKACKSGKEKAER